MNARGAIARSALAVLSGLLLAASFPKPTVWPLAWVALVPLLTAIRGCRPRTAYGYAWLAGSAFYVPVLYWISPTISNFTRLGVVPSSLICLLLCTFIPLYTFGPFAALSEWLAARGRSRILVAPLAWVVFEWSRTFFIGAFPWASLGYSQYRWLTVVQIADIGSVYVLSALIVVVNVALAELVAGGRRAVGAVATAAALLVLTLGYGSLRLAAVDGAPVVGSVPVGFVQGNIAQGDKWSPELRDAILKKYLDMSAEAVAAGATLIAWPEASVPVFLGRDLRTRFVTGFAREHGVHMLVGAPGLEREPGGYPVSYNRAWSVTPEGTLEGPYDKMQLVPFGEYIPLAGIFGRIEVAVEAAADFGRGTEHVVFEGPVMEPVTGSTGEPRPLRYGALICYEGIFPDFTRRFVAGGADLLVNISNDAWYGRTSAPYQHLAMVALRAIENRVPVVRATNTGVSAFIDANGAIGGTSPLFEPDVAVERVLLRDMDSPYRHVGNAFVYLCVIGVVVLVVLAKRNRSARSDD